MGTTAGESYNATLHIQNPDQSASKVLGYGNFAYTDASAVATFSSSLYFGLNAAQAANIAAVRFLASSGNLNTGTIAVYGLSKS